MNFVILIPFKSPCRGRAEMWSVTAFLVLVGASYDITQAFARIAFFEETMNLPFAFGLMDDVRGQNSGWQECPTILVDELQHHNAPFCLPPIVELPNEITRI
jgi:hypothetical protein